MKDERALADLLATLLARYGAARLQTTRTLRAKLIAADNRAQAAWP